MGTARISVSRAGRWLTEPEEFAQRQLQFSLERFADRVRSLTVRLTDFDVDPFHVTRAPAVDIEKRLAERPIGGLGLHLVRRMADTLRYEFVDRRSTITFTKSLG